MSEAVERQTIFAEMALVCEDHDECPTNSFDPYEGLGPKTIEWISEFGDRGNGLPNIADIAHNMPVEFYAKIGTEKSAKVMLSNKYCIDSSIEKKLCEEPALAVIKKIKSSIWRWSFKSAKWNETVLALKGIKNFDLDVPGLEIKLTWSNGYNPLGYSEHDRIWLDGTFGFLLYWKGEHVMTIGFTIATKKTLLVQQIQTTRETGNRWLYKMPANRVEHVINCFVKAFPEHNIHIADGADYCKRSMRDYKDALEARKAMLERETGRDKEDLKDEITRLKHKVRKLRGDMPRIVSFYRNVGRYQLGPVFKAQNMKHYKIEA